MNRWLSPKQQTHGLQVIWNSHCFTHHVNIRGWLLIFVEMYYIAYPSKQWITDEVKTSATNSLIEVPNTTNLDVCVSIDMVYCISQWDHLGCLKQSQLAFLFISWGIQWYRWDWLSNYEPLFTPRAIPSLIAR